MEREHTECCVFFFFAGTRNSCLDKSVIEWEKNK